MSVIYGGIRAMSATCVRQGMDRSYSYTVHVITTAGEGPLAVTMCEGLPIEDNSIYVYGNESDQSALCTHLTPRQLTPTDWEVTCQFSTQKASGNAQRSDPSRYADNPLLDALDIRFSGSNKDKTAAFDFDRKPVCNSAGQPYGQDVSTYQQPVGMLRITKNEPYANFALWYEFSNAVNTGPFYMAAAGWARMRPPEASLMRRNGLNYWQVVYAFDIDKDGWLRHELDAGDYYWENGVRKAAVAKDDAGAGFSVGTKVLLDGYGAKVAQQSTPGERLANAVYNTFRFVNFRDFSALGLGG